MKKSFYYTVSRPAALLVCTVILSSFHDKSMIKVERQKDYDTIIVSRPLVLPKQMSFAGEAVPLERWEVREQLEREFLLIAHETGAILYIMKLTGRWFPLIEELLKANDIPDDLKYLCVAEGYLENAISKSMAVGFWQFMPKTAPDFNLEINSEVDERYNVAQSTEAACKFLKNAYRKFGSWTAAAASYNCGQGAYERHAAFQRTKNFYDLYTRDETNQYIFRILAFKHLLENRERYGYKISPDEMYQPLKTKTLHIVRTIDNLSQFARNNGITYRMLRILNPWIRGERLTVKGGKTYTILLPAEKNK